MLVEAQWSDAGVISPAPTSWPEPPDVRGRVDRDRQAWTVEHRRLATSPLALTGRACDAPDAQCRVCAASHVWVSMTMAASITAAIRAPAMSFGR